MYEIRLVSNDRVVTRFTDLKRAKWWLEDNNILDGEPAALFKNVKTTAKNTPQVDSYNYGNTYE